MSIRMHRNKSIWILEDRQRCEWSQIDVDVGLQL